MNKKEDERDDGKSHKIVMLLIYYGGFNWILTW